MRKMLTRCVIAALAIVAATFLSCSKSHAPAEGGVDENLVLGKVAGKSFTVRDLEDKMKNQ